MEWFSYTQYILDSSLEMVKVVCSCYVVVPHLNLHIWVDISVYTNI